MKTLVRLRDINGAVIFEMEPEIRKDDLEAILKGYNFTRTEWRPLNPSGPMDYYYLEFQRL